MTTTTTTLQAHLSPSEYDAGGSLEHPHQLAPVILAQSVTGYAAPIITTHRVDINGPPHALQIIDDGRQPPALRYSLKIRMSYPSRARHQHTGGIMRQRSRLGFLRQRQWQRRERQSRLDFDIIFSVLALPCLTPGASRGGFLGMHHTTPRFFSASHASKSESSQRVHPADSLTGAGKSPLPTHRHKVGRLIP